MADTPGEITLLLDAWGRGERDALHQLAPLVYPHLQRLAASYLRRESNAHMLQATALVNELFVSLMARRQARFTDRQHFYALSATLMRMALVDHARRVRSEKRGGRVELVPLHDDLPWWMPPGPASSTSIGPGRARAARSRALSGGERPLRARLHGGQTAELLGISRVTVNRAPRSALRLAGATLGTRTDG